MRLLAPAFAAMRSTRAPASPWVANSCFAASRMRSRMPSGSRCHVRIRFGFDFAAELALDLALDFACALATASPGDGAAVGVSRERRFGPWRATLRSLSRLRGRAGVGVSPRFTLPPWREFPPRAALHERSDLPRKRERWSSVPRRPLQKQRLHATRAAAHGHDARAGLAARARVRDVDAGLEQTRPRSVDV